MNPPPLEAQPFTGSAPTNPSTGHDNAVPLCVDLDGTLVKTDCLWETAVQILFRRPALALKILLGCWRGHAWVKREFGRSGLLPVESLPYNAAVLNLIKAEKANGRKILLVTASDQLMAEAVAAHVKLFDEAHGSDGVSNLKGPTKAALLVQRFGRGGYDYAGDSRADIAVWESGRTAYVVNPVPAAKRWIARHGSSSITVEDARGGWGALARALRPQHWVKNILIFLPILAAHLWRHSEDKWLHLAGFFFALCFGASAVYLINDLADVDSDRRHKEKRRRPIAAGEVPIATAVLAVPVCLGLAFCCCLIPGWPAAALLLVYLVATSLYSAGLKKIPILDVLLLSGFYVYRIVAGAAVSQVELSPWLIAFAMFLFLSLAAAKRYVELIGFSDGQNVNASRGYLREDYPMIAGFGLNCGCLAVLVLGLYVNSDKFQLLYPRAWVFWLLCPLLLYWLIRVWLLAGRRKLHEDPLVFALKDPTTWVIAVLGCIVFLVAISGIFR